MLGLAMVVAAALAGDGASSLEFRGETGCPTPDAVRAQLAPLAPGPWPPEAAVTAVELAQARDRATDRDSLVVTLFGAEHERLQQRHLALYPGCDERARAVAVVIASWLTTLPAGAPAPVRLPVVPTVPVLPAATVARAGTSPAAPSRALVVRLAAAALASLAADGVAPGLMAEAAIEPPDARWSASLAGLLDGTHRLTVGQGQATWWRWGGAAGGAWRPVRGRVWLDVRAAFLFTRLHIAGSGFLDDGGGTTWDLGAAVGTRLGYAWPRVQPWMGAWVVGWGGTQGVHLVGAALRDELPRLQGLIGVGATFGARLATF